MTAYFFERLAAPDDRVALRVGETTLSYRALDRAARGYLRALEAGGARPGDRIALYTHRSVATPIALAAHAAAGYVSVPLNEKLGPRELDHILGDASPRRVVAAVYGDEPVEDVEALSGAEVIRIRDDAPTSDGPNLEHGVDASPALILYTSGTTGAPKGAVIRYDNAAADLDGLAEAWAWSEADTVVHALPLFHVHGLVLGLFGALRVGGALSWVPRFDAETLAAAAAREASAMLFTVPTMVHRLLDVAEGDPEVAGHLKALRLWVSGSAGLPVREHRRAEALLGRGIIERYGLTETLIVCAVRAAEGPRPGYVGRPIRAVELRLVDDARVPLDVHDDATIGEVAIRGATVFEGYLDDADATAAVRDANGWFYTGDLATRASDGAIRIVGRRSTDLIKTGGFKVGAGEIEAVILEDAAVAECAVLGVDDPDLGQRIVAFVVLREGTRFDADALRARVADELTPHKRPREVRVVDALPRNAMGKVQKKRLLAP